MGKFNWGMRACGALLLWAATAITLPAQTMASVPPVQTPLVAPRVTFTTLFSFDDYANGPYFPAELIQTTDGALYGTTFYGGNRTCNPPYGCGTVFRITASGKLTTLHSFDHADGWGPDAGLVQSTAGNLYGPTAGGGTSNACNPGDGCGTVFKMTPGGTLTTLHSFDNTDGWGPRAVLVQGTDGDFYGATEYGGADTECNCGTVFRVNASGKLTTLHSFAYTDGRFPNGLVESPDGNFYGTTGAGGSNDSGTVFKITPKGAQD
jgi:uncharacterized repeat protein (TIGR03803 family)